MTTITNIKELPFITLRAYTVRDEAKAREIAGGRESWLLNATWDGVLYLFVKEG